MGKIKLQNHVIKNNFATTHAMETFGGVKLQLHSLIISALDGGEWSPYGPANLKLGSAPHKILNKRLSNFRAFLDVLKESSFPLSRKLNHDSSVVQTVYILF